MEYLWSGWRAANWPHLGGDGEPHADLGREPGKSLFETIEQSGLPDSETYIVWRGANTFAILNVFPYTSGHLMVLPTVAAPSVVDLDDAIHDELWRSVRSGMRAVRDALRPEGMNVGINEGQAGGGSVPEHLHVHIVPRRRADTNFMTTTADARVLPVTLSQTWQQLRDAWPED